MQGRLRRCSLCNGVLIGLAKVGDDTLIKLFPECCVEKRHPHLDKVGEVALRKMDNIERRLGLSCGLLGLRSFNVKSGQKNLSSNGGVKWPHELQTCLRR